MTKFSIEQEMDSFLKSAEMKSLFSVYKTAQDSNSFESADADKFPLALLTLEKLGWADKYPLAYQELCDMHVAKGGKEDDFMLADDMNKFKEKNPEAYEALVSSGLLDKFPEFFSDKIGGDDDIMNQDVDHDLDVSDLGTTSVEGLEGFASFDVAVDGLLSASAALDNLGFVKSATEILTLTSLIVEAKKKAKEKKDSKSKSSKDKDSKKKDDKKDGKKPFPPKKDSKEKDSKEKDSKDSKSSKDKDSDKKKVKTAATELPGLSFMVAIQSPTSVIEPYDDKKTLEEALELAKKLKDPINGIEVYIRAYDYRDKNYTEGSKWIPVDSLLGKK